LMYGLSLDWQLDYEPMSIKLPKYTLTQLHI